MKGNIMKTTTEQTNHNVLKVTKVTETDDPKYKEEVARLGVTIVQAWDVSEDREIVASLFRGRLSTRNVVLRETADDWDELVSLDAALKDPFDLENIGTTRE